MLSKASHGQEERVYRGNVDRFCSIMHDASCTYHVLVPVVYSKQETGHVARASFKKIEKREKGLLVVRTLEAHLLLHAFRKLETWILVPRGAATPMTSEFVFIFNFQPLSP
jgi:hypothetical protein